MAEVNIIAAVASDGTIGKNGSIPWDIPEDRSYFRRLTTGNVCIMGRRTFESIGRPLPERQCIVVSSEREYTGEMLCSAISLREAIEKANAYITENSPSASIFLCGGSRIYSEGLELACRLYLTELDRPYHGDTLFPEFSSEDFICISRRSAETPGCTFAVYERTGNKKYTGKGECSMKLAEALQERADLNRNIAQLRERLCANAIVQENESPAEDPKDLLNELNSSIDRLQELMERINLTNSLVEYEGRTITQLIAQKDCLKVRISAYKSLVSDASQTGHRARMTEIKLLSTVDVKKLQSEIDKMSKELRLLDNTIQSLNWTTELK